MKGAQSEDNKFCKNIISSLKSKTDKYKDKGFYLKLGLLMRQFTNTDGQAYEVIGMCT